MNYVYKPSAEKGLRKLPKDAQRRIVAKLEYYFTQPRPLDYARKTTDLYLGEYRFRVGDYRVIFGVLNGQAELLIIDHSKDIYRL